jgi:hypothetical protein
MEPLAPAAVVAETLKLMSPALKSAGVSVENRLPDGLPTVSATRVGVQQVLSNLLQNAIDALEDQTDRRICIDAEIKRLEPEPSRLRQRPRGAGAPAPAHLRRLLHHQAPGAGHRSWSRHLPAHPQRLQRQYGVCHRPRGRRRLLHRRPAPRRCRGAAASQAPAEAANRADKTATMDANDPAQPPAQAEQGPT